MPELGLEPKHGGVLRALLFFLRCKLLFAVRMHGKMGTPGFANSLIPIFFRILGSIDLDLYAPKTKSQ